MKRVLIVGCPRSGSTWATFLLSQHPAIATFQHAKVFDYLSYMERWYRSKAGFSFILNGTKPLAAEPSKDDNVRLAESITADVWYALLRHVAVGIYGAVAEARPGASVIVDKTPENGRMAEFILKVLPDAYFLHIVRDPRSVFSSHRAASSWAKGVFPTQPADGARFWCDHVLASLGIASLTDRYLQVRYEDLQKSGPEELAGILSWLGLEADREFCARAVAASTKEKVRSVKNFPTDFVRSGDAGWRHELSPRDVRIIEHLAGDLMAQLGYERVEKPYRVPPLGVWLRDLPIPALDFLGRKLSAVFKRTHWKLVGRRLEWPEP
jgi:hypothetical protein